MKPLFSAILETIVLVVSIFLVMLCVRLFKYESPYANFKETHPNSVITLGEAIGYLSDGTTSPEAAAAEAAAHIFGTATEKKLPLPIAKILCIEVGERTARVLEFYPFIVFLASILCLIFGITLPCSLYRHLDPAKAINDSVIDKNRVYVDEHGRTYGNVGETRAGILKILLLLLMLFAANIWCFFLPVFIIVNFTVGIIMAVLRLVGINASNSAAKAKIDQTAGKDGKDTYRIIVENGLFAVSGDVHPNRRIYFKQYWNAVIAKRLFELDRDGLPFTNDDAKEMIVYGDEDLHKRFETSLKMDRAKLMTSPTAKEAAKKLEDEIKSADYVYTFVARGAVKGEYMIMSKFSGRYMLFRRALNCSLMLAVLKSDAAGEDFDMIAYGRWERLGEDGQYQLLQYFDGRTEPPQGEEKPVRVQQA